MARDKTRDRERQTGTREEQHREHFAPNPEEPPVQDHRDLRQPNPLRVVPTITTYGIYDS